MVAQQFNRLIDEIPAMLGPCTLVAPSQLPEHLPSRPRTHRFVHVGDGNRTFGATTLSAPQSKPLAGNKHSGASREWALEIDQVDMGRIFMCPFSAVGRNTPNVPRYIGSQLRSGSPGFTALSRPDNRLCGQLEGCMHGLPHFLWLKSAPV